MGKMNDTIQPWCFVLSVAVVIASCDAHALYQYQATVGDWEIKGKIVLEKGEKPPALNELKWQLLRLRESPQYGNARVSAPLEVDSEGGFRIAPRDKESKFNWLGPHRYVLGFFWDGRLATSEPFEVKNSPFRLNDLKIIFGPKSSRILRARIVDPESGNGRPKERVVAFLPEEHFPQMGLGNLRLAEVFTDEQGFLRIDNLPEGSIGLYSAEAKNLGPSMALVSKGAASPKIVIPTMPAAEGAAIKEDKIPLIYRIENGKGMICDAWNVDDPQTGWRPMRRGTELEFTAKDQTEQSVSWNPNLKFRVIVGEGGLVKSPVVPQGKYTIETVSGDSWWQKELCINGILCLDTDGQSPSLGQGSKAQVEYPNALLTPGPEFKLLCSAAEPLRIRVRNTGWSGQVKLSSAKFSEAMNATKTIEGTWIEFSLDYNAQAPLSEPDIVTLTAMPSRGPTSKPLCELKVYPIRVQLQANHAGLHALMGWFTPVGEEAGESDGRDKFKYTIRPWDPLLKEHLYFVALPPYFCSATATFSTQGPTDKSGEVDIQIQAKPPGVGAVTVMLGKELWTECCEQRLPISLMFVGDKPSQGLLAPMPNPKDSATIDMVLDEIYPEPRDEKTKSGLDKIRKILQQHGVPHLAPALRAFTKETREQLIKAATQPWEVLIMELGELAIPFAPPPPKPAVEK